MAVQRKYRLNISKYNSPLIVAISQYDEGYALVFDAYDGTTAASLSGYTVKLIGVRSDGLKYDFDGTISGNNHNVLSFVIDTTMSGTYGRGLAEIQIMQNGVLFATFNIIVMVEKAPVPNDAVDADVQRAEAIAETVHADALAAVSAKNDAEAARDATIVAQGKAEDAQEAAETAQGKAEDAQEAAETSADRAEQAAQNAGYMFFNIDENGDLIYQRTENVDVDFYLEDGDLFVEATE